MNSNESKIQLQKISDKLDVLIRLTALNLVKGIAAQKDQITALSSAGFEPREIAAILGTTSTTVRVTLYKGRKGANIKEDSKAARADDEVAEIDSRMKDILTDEK